MPDTLADTVQEKLGRRPAREDMDRDFLSLMSLPVPMRKDVKSGILSVPLAAEKIEPVLRNGCEVDYSEHGTMIWPGIIVIRCRLAKIVETGPDELTDGPWIVILH